HLIEVPAYLALLALGLALGGITGAACAWTVRTAIDALVMFWLAQRLQLLDLRRAEQRALWGAFTLVALVGAAAVLLDGGAFAVLVAVAAAVAVALSLPLTARLLDMPARSEDR